MTKSHGHQQSKLLDELVRRATDRTPGLSKQAMVMSYGFDDEAQLNHAIAALVECGAIGIDIDGRFPSFRIYKKRMRTMHMLARPLFLSAGTPILSKPSALAPVGWQDAAKFVGTAIASQALDEQRQPDAPRPPITRPVEHTPTAAPAAVATGVLSPDAMSPSKPCPTPTPSTAVEEALKLETERDQAIPYYVSFRLPKEDFSWLLDELDRTGGPIALPALARDMLLAEMDRRRSPDAAKHKISARVIRTAREEGLDLATFVTSLIEVGLTAREMNRRGI